MLDLFENDILRLQSLKPKDTKPSQNQDVYLGWY